jgi:hypothetical protein
MDNNSVHKKILQFVATEISVNEFLDLLKLSNRTNKMNIRWRTEGSADGSGKPVHMTQHLIWWDSSAYVGGSAGGSDTKAFQDQLNLMVTPGSNNWRTLSYQNIDSVTFKDKKYIIK